jgi:hypothetical protein
MNANHTTSPVHASPNKTEVKQIKPNQMLIDGRLCGVQSCDNTSANVFMIDDGGICQYVRLDREARLAIPPERMNVAYAFVQTHFNQFDDLCSKLEAE